MGMQNQDMNLVLSTDAKPRLKWTPELHQRFIDAVSQLGGAHKATPKTLMRMMGIHGLTLYHLKSHLQKFRLGKSQQSETSSDDNKLSETWSDADFKENPNTDVDLNNAISDGTQIQTNESFKVAQALQMQMEVQRNLHEQIEVQRHLQLRIEAQGKYLQSVLKKAQETLAGYNPSSAGVELAKSELSELVSMVNNTNCTSPLSDLTEIGNPSLKNVVKKLKIKRDINGSMESSSTSSASSDRDKQTDMNPTTRDYQMFNETPVVLPLMETVSNARKRSGSSVSDGNCFGRPYGKRSLIQNDENGDELRMFGFSETLDLNNQYQSNMNSGPEGLDLNCKGI